MYCTWGRRQTYANLPLTRLSWLQLGLMLPGGRRDRPILVWIVVVGPRPTAPYPALHGNIGHCPVEALRVDLITQGQGGASSKYCWLAMLISETGQ
jgi:hypothetical protein